VRITIPKDAVCGKTPIPAADYWVSLNASGGEISLSAAGRDIKVKATKRRSTSKSKTTSVQFFCGGGKLWSLVISTPKMGEYVAFIEYV